MTTHRPTRTPTSYEEVDPRKFKLGDLVEFGWLGLCEVIQEAAESNGWTAHIRDKNGTIMWMRRT